MDYTPHQLESMMADWANRADKAGKKWGKMAGETNSVDDRKNDVLAKLIGETEGSSHAERDRKARCSKEWTAFRANLSTAKAGVLNLRVLYDAAIRNWETARSLLSSANTQRRTNT